MKRHTPNFLRGMVIIGAFYAGAQWGALGSWKRTCVLMVVCFAAGAVLGLADYIGVTHGKGKGR